jgi:DNA-binding IclR family transcriptional regulator
VISDATAARDGAVRSVDRAISLLQLLAQRGDARVTDLAREIGVHKSTAFRLLSTLEARGLVEQNSERGSYALAYGVVLLAAGATRKLDLSVVSRPICGRVAEAVGETVNIAIRDGADVVSIDQVIGSAAVTSVNWVGQRTPLHATSAGKVFLAAMDPVVARELLGSRLVRFTERTQTDPAVLIDELAQCRLQGFATSFEEHETGLHAIAAPIRAADGRVVAAITVSGPAFRLTREAVPAHARIVVAAADEISRRNGDPKLG